MSLDDWCDTDFSDPAATSEQEDFCNRAVPTRTLSLLALVCGVLAVIGDCFGINCPIDICVRYRGRRFAAVCHVMVIVLGVPAGLVLERGWKSVRDFYQIRYPGNKSEIVYGSGIYFWGFAVLIAVGVAALGTWEVAFLAQVQRSESKLSLKAVPEPEPVSDVVQVVGAAGSSA